jgi:hypothetical protein
MKRYLVLLVVVGLAAGALAPAQAAKKKKKKAPVPTPVTYTVVWSDATCALSTSAELATDEGSCGDPFGGSTTGPVAGSGEPVAVAAIDGLPLTLDAAVPVKGTLQFGSYTLAALADAGAGAPLGIGQAEWHIVLSGTSGDEDVTIGEVTTDPYTVTPGPPGSPNYEVTFEFTPAAELAGKVLDTLSLSFEQTGSATLHGALQTDGTSKLTLGSLAVPK